MAVLARASQTELQAIVTAATAPKYEILKVPEIGSVMIEGRAGGAGRRFNLGEATVTRCVVRIDGGVMGHAYALGRDKQKATLAALLDAVLQVEPEGGPAHAGIARLAAEQASRRATASRKAAATKVEFFTLVRGE
jgi:alpha-D-ribose 1-methylphosphonate 5-triphosphate synthase subunit PhnG